VRNEVNGESRPLAGKRLGFFGKGGSGKSTLVVLLGTALRRRGYEVLILDADSTNVGLSQALGVSRAPASLLDFYGGMVFRGGKVTCPVDDPTPLAGGTVRFDDIPDSYHGESEEGIVLFVAGKIGSYGPGAGCDGPIAKIARDFAVHGLGDATVTLVDFKAGFEDSARGVLTQLDWAVQVVDPTVASVQMAGDMKRMIEQIQAGVPPATKHLDSPKLEEIAVLAFREARVRGLSVVLNRIRDEGLEAVLTDLLRVKGLAPIGAVRDDPEISGAWLRGDPVKSVVGSRDADGIARILEEALRAEIPQDRRANEKNSKLPPASVGKEHL
jgi:CO dehydrogenase nickel-insertion accessory protein CooC1